MRRREEIVNAALEVLGEVGPEFGLEQVAARAGVTKPVVYRYFSDRAGLVGAMGERATAMLLERLVPAVHADLALMTRVRLSIEAFVTFVDESPNVYWIFVRHAPAGGLDIARTGKHMIAEVLAAVLGDELNRLGVSTGAVRVWAYGLIGFVQCTAEWWLEHRPMSRDDLIDQLTTLVWAQIDGFVRQHGVTIAPDLSLNVAVVRPRLPADDSIATD